MEIENGGVAEENGLIVQTCSFDMGWQKKGRTFNSLTGYEAVMGLKTGQVTNINQSKPHDCRKNHSKIMETEVACQLFKEAPKNNVKFSSYVRDVDSTTLAELVKQTPYKLQKYSDIIHINLSQRIKFPNSSILSQKVMNYCTLLNIFHTAFNKTRVINQNFQKSLKSIIPHVFGDHSNCNPSWWKIQIL